MVIQVDVFSPLPESWGLCQSCETLMEDAQIGDRSALRGFDEYPAEWQNDFRRLSDLVIDLSSRFGESVSIHLYDPRSLPGLLKAVRHRVHRYPTFIISHKEKVTGWNLPALEECLFRAGARITGKDEIETHYER